MQTFAHLNIKQAAKDPEYWAATAAGETIRMSVSAMRMPVPCGREDDLSAGREPCQEGWYKFASDHVPCVGCTVLDVGAGTCEGIKLLGSKGIFAIGLENDLRLQGKHPGLLIGEIEWVPANAFDMVTCIDVIEHEVYDLELLMNLLRVARRRVIVSTPNFDRSAARNTHHAREVNLNEFMYFYQPDELWVGSPDGHTHITQLIDRANAGMYRILKGRDAGRLFPYGEGRKFDFSDTTVDGCEWAHMTGVWNL